MKLKTTITAMALAAVASTANAAIVTIDNFSTETDAGDGNGWIGTHSFTPATAGGGTNDTVAANLPLPATIFLTSATFVRGADGAVDSGVDTFFLNVYQGGAGNTGTFIGSSTAAFDVTSVTVLSAMTWSFDNLSLDATQQHAFVFSTTNVAGGDTNYARVELSGNTAYTGGNGNFFHNATGAAGNARFATTFETVPEPSSTALLGLGGLALIMRRRK